MKKLIKTEKKMKLELLEQIIENEYTLPEENGIDIYKDILMENLGSNDPEVRESSLEIIWTWIEKGYFTIEELTGIGNEASANL